MALLSIKTLTEAANAAGFRARGSDGYFEIFAPESTGPEVVWHGGCAYSACDFVLHDRAANGYGYNMFFYGPWHIGFVKSTDYGVQKLLAHPAMQGVAA